MIGGCGSTLYIALQMPPIGRLATDVYTDLVLSQIARAGLLISGMSKSRT
jgi:hypothetical protein